MKGSTVNAYMGNWLKLERFLPLDARMLKRSACNLSAFNHCYNGVSLCWRAAASLHEH